MARSFTSSNGAGAGSTSRTRRATRYPWPIGTGSGVTCPSASGLMAPGTFSNGPIPGSSAPAWVGLLRVAPPTVAANESKFPATA